MEMQMAIADEVKIVIEVMGFGITAGAILWKLSGAIKTFEIIGKQQAKEIAEIKATVDKLSTVLVEIARQDGRINGIESRLQATGIRLDELTNRFNKLADATVLPR